MTGRRMLRASVLAGAALAACEGGGARRVPADAAARALAGTWELRLTLDRPPIVGQAFAPAVRARTIRGQLALVLGADGRAAPDGTPALDGPPTHYGTFAVDFSPFGFDPTAVGAPGLVPAAVGRERAGAGAARTSDPDSVVLVLDPGADGEGVVLRGTYAGAAPADSVAGGWTVAGAGRAPSPGAGAGGRFVMRRAAVDGRP